MTRHPHRPNRLPERVFLSVGVLAFAWLLVYTGWLWRGDLMVYDAMLQFSARPTPSDIAIVAIDERSLTESGRWPWPHRLHADLIDRLTEAGAKVIGIDLLFTESDARDPDGDRLLAQAVARNGRVVLAVAPTQLDRRGQLIELLPLPELARAAAGLGHVEVEPDRDGLARSVYLQIGLGSPRWPSLAMEMLMVAAGHYQRSTVSEPPAEPARTPAPRAWVRSDWVRIPFAAPPGGFEQFSYIEVLNGVVPRDALQGKFVLIGVTVAGLESMLPAPVYGLEQPMPGVEIHAHVLAALRENRAIHPLPLGGQWLLTSLCVLLPLLLYLRLPRCWTPLVLGLMLLFTLTVSLLLLQAARVWFGPLPALLALSIGYPVWAWRRWEGLTAAPAVQEQPMLHLFDDGAIMIGRNDRIRYLNPGAERLTGCLGEQVPGTTLGTLLQVASPDGEEPVTSLVARCRQQGRAISLEHPCRLRSRTGREYTVRLSATPLSDPDGGGVLLMLKDVTQEEAITRRLAHRANYDLLTNLPNRHLLQDRLTHALARTRRSGRRIAVLLIDLDRFKAVNEQMGHAAGDALLVEMAARLQACTWNEDTVARLGGDEFMVVLQDVVEADSAREVADNILMELQRPVTLTGRMVSVSASIGISVFPGDGSNEYDLLARAEAAICAAKASGGNTICFCSDGLQQTDVPPTPTRPGDNQIRAWTNARGNRSLPLPAGGVGGRV